MCRLGSELQIANRWIHVHYTGILFGHWPTYMFLFSFAKYITATTKAYIPFVSIQK
jgi:hypothetical protein